MVTGMFCRRLSLCALLCTLVTAPAVAQKIPAFKNGAEVGQFMDEEDRLWTHAQEFDVAIAKAGHVDPTNGFSSYLQTVTDSLFPEFVGKIKVHVFRSPHLNAFALANGSIYINQGLLARIRNEAQLAALLSHEGSHFVHRHGFANQRSFKRASGFAVGARLLGIPLLGDLLALSSIYGYSRELENDADGAGFQRMQMAGYDAQEGISLFKALQAEIKAIDAKEPFLFASHPKLQERIDNYRKMINGNSAPGELAAERYLENSAEIRTRNLQTDIAMARYASVISVLENPLERQFYEPTADFYLGEAYRLRGKPGDEKLMAEAYQKATVAAPEFAPTYKAVGIAAMKQGRKDDALAHFQKYLELQPSATDRGYIEAYAIQLTGESKK